MVHHNEMYLTNPSEFTHSFKYENASYCLTITDIRDVNDKEYRWIKVYDKVNRRGSYTPVFDLSDKEGMAKISFARMYPESYISVVVLNGEIPTHSEDV